MKIPAMVVVGVLSMMACKDKGAASKSPPAAAAQESGETASAPAAKRESAAAKKAELAMAMAVEARTAFDQWLKAQNDGNYEGYAALYNPHYFKGVKRTTSGAIKRMKHAAWLADRKRMFKNKPVVAAADVAVKTWLDSDSKLKKGVSEIRFVQRWKTERYADHGIKILHLWRDPKGAQTIIYEDLVNAEPGWDDEVRSNIDKVDVGPVGSSEEALAAWKKLAPTGDNYEEVLGSIPEDPKVARPLALALIDGGNFDCREFDEWDECGDTQIEYKPISPTAGLANPCLRRRLATWALEHLTTEDLAVREAILVSMVSVKGPDDDLVGDVLAETEKVGVDTWLKVLKAAWTANQVDDVEVAVGSLKEQAVLIRVYKEVGVPSVIEALLVDAEARIADQAPGYQALFDTLDVALADEDVDRVARGKIIEVFAAVARREKSFKEEILDSLTSPTGDCELDMAAAEARHALGQKGALPSRGDRETDEDRLLCLLSHGTTEHSQKELAAMIPKGGVAVSITRESDGYYNDDGEIEGREQTEDETIADAESLAEQARRFLDLEEGDKASFSWEVGKDGGPLLKSIEATVWSGCGC